jgi:hypothetical protein
MSIYKRGGTWWTDFSLNGQRFRQSLDTSDWREAQSREKDRIGQQLLGSSRRVANYLQSLASSKPLIAMSRIDWRTWPRAPLPLSQNVINPCATFSRP